MRKILQKEMRLSASLLSYLFIAFGLMFFFPGYPVLCGVFFVTLGIFQSFLNAREANDLLFSALLPIAKRDVVKGKYLFSCFIELCGFAVMVLATVIRMTLLSEAALYRENALMNANPFALGVALFLFGLFNLLFVDGFFRTAVKFAKPFVTYCIVGFLGIALAETLHHLPGLAWLNAFGFDSFPAQFACFLAGLVSFFVLTLLAYRHSVHSFETIDL